MTSFYVFQMQCRDITCFESRLYDPAKYACEVILGRMEKVCYALFLKLTSFGEQLHFRSLASALFISRIHQSFDVIIPDMTSMVEQFGILIAGVVVDHDDYLDSFVVHLLLKTDMYQNFSVLERLSNMRSLYVGGEGMPVYLFGVDQLSYGLNGPAVDATSLFATNNSLSLINLTTIHSTEFDGLMCTDKDILPFTRIKLCPYISFGVDEINVDVQNDVLIINEINVNFSNWEYEIHSDKIYMCLDDYGFINRQLEPREMSLKSNDKSLAADVKGILALVCVCLSLLSLLATIFIYSYFTLLQSQPGVNNLILCICLLFAQIVYQFGAGQTSLPKWACALVGAISHFLWLSALFSMNICSVHIYLTFSKNQKISAKYDCKQTTIYVTYIILASLAFVLVNIIVSLAQSSWQEIGYGGSLCYISSNLMQSITFLLPLSVLLIANIALFVVVVFKINRIKEAIENTKKERNFLLIYARLSSLTGITWIIGVFQVLIKHEILEYLFIIFNASQGVFIMIAFVLNKRIVSLFCYKTNSSSSTS